MRTNHFAASAQRRKVDEAQRPSDSSTVYTVCFIYFLQAWRRKVVEIDEILYELYSRLAMAPPIRAEVVFAPLKNCLVNLPSTLVALLTNSNTVSIGIGAIYERLINKMVRPHRMWSSSCNTVHRHCPAAPCPVATHPASQEVPMQAGRECLVGLDLDL